VGAKADRASGFLLLLQPGCAEFLEGLWLQSSFDQREDGFFLEPEMPPGCLQSQLQAFFGEGAGFRIVNRKEVGINFVVVHVEPVQGAGFSQLVVQNEISKLRFVARVILQSALHEFGHGRNLGEAIQARQQFLNLLKQLQENVMFGSQAFGDRHFHSKGWHQTRE